MFSNNDLIGKTVCIKHILYNLQKNIIEIYSCQNNISQLEENKFAFKEIIAKSLQVTQIFMISCG